MQPARHLQPPPLLQWRHLLEFTATSASSEWFGGVRVCLPFPEPRLDGCFRPEFRRSFTVSTYLLVPNSMERLASSKFVPNSALLPILRAKIDSCPADLDTFWPGSDSRGRNISTCRMEMLEMLLFSGRRIFSIVSVENLKTKCNLEEFAINWTGGDGRRFLSFYFFFQFCVFLDQF